MAPLQTLLTILTITTFPIHSIADPRTAVAAIICNSTQASSAAILANNAVAALNNLSTLVNSNGYGAVSQGSGPDIVYGLVQCFRDLNSTDCPLCFSQIRSQQPQCFPGIGGRAYLDGCFGRYGNYSFFDEILDSDDRVVCNASRNSTVLGFGQTVRLAVGNVSAAAPSGQGFAVGSVTGVNSTVYVLAQCWESLSSTQCGTCLNAAARNIVSCAPATEGRALYTGCYLRYSNNLFWNVNQTVANPTTKGKSKLIWIILGASLGGVLLITSIVLWIKRDLWVKRNAKFLRDLYGPGQAPAISHANLYYRYEELRKATNNFGLSHKLGQGSYGTVYKAVLSGGKDVAVKRLFLNTKQWVDQFLNEVNMINRVRHKNLVKLLGCSVDGPESLLVYEYYSNRSLDLFIFDATPEKHLDWQQRFDIIQGVAEGLCYLHEESETRIIHRDIKASNILMDEKFRPKITDFGLARSFSEDQTHLSTGVAGTRGYMAPEYVVHGHLTVKADVYSFGILVLEIVTGKRCNGALGSQGERFLLAEIWHHYKSKTLEKVIDKLLSVGREDEIVHVVLAGLLCTQADPHQRPTMSRVVEFLRSTRRDEELVLTDPPFLDVPMVGGQDGEVFHMLSGNSAADLSQTSWLSGR